MFGRAPKQGLSGQSQQLVGGVFTNFGSGIQPDIVFFSQDFHDTFLEMERLKELNRKARIIQRVMRGFKHRYRTKKTLHIYAFPS